MNKTDLPVAPKTDAHLNQQDHFVKTFVGGQILLGHMLLFGSKPFIFLFLDYDAGHDERLADITFFRP